MRVGIAIGVAVWLLVSAFISSELVGKKLEAKQEQQEGSLVRKIRGHLVTSSQSLVQQ